MSWRIEQGDCVEALRLIADESVHCCITSPPYYGLGDSYAGSGKGPRSKQASNVGSLITPGSLVSRNPHQFAAGQAPTRWLPVPFGCKAKDLIGVPWLVAFALRADGWYLRRDIIWSKSNPMPESVSDRPTTAHEYVFLLTKAQRYYYDADAIREPHADVSLARAERRRHGGKYADQERDSSLKRGNGYGPDGNATQPYAEAHFATFPEKLNDIVVPPGGRNKRSVWEVGRADGAGGQRAEVLWRVRRTVEARCRRSV